MKYIVTQRISCGLTIPNGKSLSIGKFTFLPDFEGEQAVRHIQTVVEAITKEEAGQKANKLFNDLLSKLTFIDNSRYYLLSDNSITSVTSPTSTTHTVTISAGAFITKDGNVIKKVFEQKIEKRRVRKTPLRHYRDAINNNSSFEKFREFYKVFECYYSNRTDITKWTLNELGKVEMKKNKYNKDITIFDWIRIKLSHSKKERGDLKPLLLSNSEDVLLVDNHLPKIEQLARKMIEQKEGL